MDKVKVLFRMSKNPYTKCWECEAFFPEFIASPGMMQCYSEEGWCEASLGYYHNTRKATPEEYDKMYTYLKNEFKNPSPYDIANGYDEPRELEVIKKISTKLYKNLMLKWR